jgi:hypothetical protein
VSWFLLIAVFAAILALFIYFLVKMRPREEGEVAPPITRPREKAEPVGPSTLPLAVLDADPDALAAQGRFADAIAAALLAGLRAVGWTPEGQGRSRTAREILAMVADARRDPLSELVGVEERVAFGGSEATEARWQSARGHWIALTRRTP